MKKIYAPLFLLPLLIDSCGTPSGENATNGSETEKPGSQLQKAEWMIGRWESSTDEGVLSETWKKEDNSTYSAETYFVVAGDTVFEEHVQLKEVDGKVVYSPVIPNQNNGKPTDFTMVSVASNKIVFENPKHDFPQKITYDLKGDSLIATISGKRAGKTESEVFAMKKK